ncbi:hypothetical protein [Microbacterium sp. CFBP 8801]|uniref:hypothetical protein n=1 Tax=Microbacterium sp. CFBP 8801 TaxID=2774036 RepID=UPI001A7E6DCF|nr:hypothetical protein [Microbacterium sp. CFBP 8801]
MTNKKAPEAGQGFEGQAPQEGTQMIHHTVALASAPQTPRVVPGLSQLVQAQEQLDELAARRDRLASQVIADATFMETPILSIRKFWVDGLQQAHVGDVFHVADFDASDTHGFDAHPESGCPGDWCCSPVGTVRGSGRRGPRCRFVNRGSWVLVAGPDSDGHVVFVATEAAA